MIWFSLFLSLFAAVMLYYLYDGYGRLLSWLAERRIPKATSTFDASAWPAVTVIVPVFNEEATIAARLDNLLTQQGFPDDRLEILVVSDGSTDRTHDIVDGYRDRGVKLTHTAGRVGKSLAQNHAVAAARGDILVLTDAAVEMESGCLRALVAPFADPSVGCTTARLLFRSDEASDVGQAQGYYWNYELKLRRLESALGWLATAAGPAMAIRRSLWKDLEPQFGDDCVLPLDVALQGQKVVQAEDAVAWDENFQSFKKEYRARVRMTVRNWTGTMSRSALLSPRKHPGYAFALWSHKMLRWLSPVFLLLLGVGLGLLWLADGPGWPLVFYLAGLLAGGVGVFAMSRGIHLPGLSTLASFLIANAGFAMGLRQVMAGRLIRVYDNR